MRGLRGDLTDQPTRVESCLRAECRGSWSGTSSLAALPGGRITENYGSFGVDEIDERTAVGGDDEDIFSVPERATTPAVADGVSLVKTEKIDDTWFLCTHRFLGEGEGSA